MENQNNNPIKRQGQYTNFEAQMVIVFKAFYEHPKTMLMVSVETGILRANICRYVANWRNLHKIEPVKNGRCTITRHDANYLTTNPSFFPKSNQLSLFEI
jgi:hypothetical protein